MRQTVRIARMLFREFDIELGERQAGEDDGPKLYPISFSSETPVERWTWDGEPYFEILSHDPADVDLSRAENGLPALKTHRGLLHFGSVTGIRLDAAARRLRGFLGFSSIRLGQEQQTMVDEGHLRTISVGYQPLAMRLESTDETTGVPTYRVKWRPLEVSTAPIPADATVGVGRGERNAESDHGELSVVEIEISDPTTGGERTMEPKVDPKIETRSAPDGPAPVTPEPRVEVEARKQDRNLGAEAAEIAEMCNVEGLADRAPEWIRAEFTPDQVGRMLLDLKRTKGGAPTPPSEALDLPEPDQRRYSVQRAIRIAAQMDKLDGVEAEVHQELAKSRSGADHGGVLVPWRFGSRSELSPAMVRTLGTGEATGGATLVGTTTMPEMIDLLRNKALCLVAGARLFPGLAGVVQFNKKTGAPTVYWMAENPAAGATVSQPTYSYVDLSPKTLIGNILVPRQLLTMASIDVEADIRMELATGHALALDLAALHGTGTSNQPEGIYAAADVLSKAFGGVPTLAKVSAMVGLLAAANADVGALSWMAHPALAELLTRTVKESGYPVYLWNGKLSDGEMLGYAARSTNQLSATLPAGTAHGMVFGNWSDLMFGLWGNDLEIVVDPYTKKTSGQIEIASYSMADVALRRPESFCKATGATLS